MTGIENRVEEFLKVWKETHCRLCEAELKDGSFIMINQRLICLKCYGETKAGNIHEQAE